MKKKTAPSSPAKSGRSKKQKQATQRTAMQRVMVVGPSGKRRLEWREW